MIDEQLTKLEFALKHFKEGAKLIITENKISTFSVGEVLIDFTEQDWCLFASISWNETPQETKNNAIGAKYVREENSGLIFYLITEEY